MKKQGFFKKEVVRIFQWIKYSQTKEFVLNKNHWTLTF